MIIYTEVLTLPRNTEDVENLVNQQTVVISILEMLPGKKVDFSIYWSVLRWGSATYR